MKKKKILIVEDNLDLNEMYQMVFEENGYEVGISTDGINAVPMAHQLKPDVILLDIMMPLVSGYDVLKTLRSKEDTTTIIIASNLSQESDITKSKELGADEYLRKSDFTPIEMVKKVNEFLEKKGE